MDLRLRFNRRALLVLHAALCMTCISVYGQDDPNHDDCNGCTSEMATKAIQFKGAASGGELILANTLNRNAKYVSIDTNPGESGESVASRLAAAIVEAWSKKNMRFAVRSNGDLLEGLPLDHFLLAGTEQGFGIPRPPLSLTCVYDKENDQVILRWENPPNGYHHIAIILNWSNYDHRGGFGLPGTATSFVIDLKTHPVNVKDLDVWLIGYRNHIPSNAAAIHLSGNSQEELFGIPFTDGVAPNWTGWSAAAATERTRSHQLLRANYVHVKGNRFNPIRKASTKPFYQVVKPTSGSRKAGVSRKFLGLTPGHTYRISARLNTLEMDDCKSDWSFSLHAAHNGQGGSDLTVDQLSGGLAALPDGNTGPTAGQMASYGPGVTTNGKWIKRSMDITLPAGVDTITVWVRHSGSDSTGVGIDWIKLEDLSM